MTEKRKVKIIFTVLMFVFVLSNCEALGLRGTIPKETKQEKSGQEPPATVKGHVVSVADGDTVTLTDGANSRYVIRLQGIDAPEHKQPFGSESKDVLKSLVDDKDDVVVTVGKKDRYGRIVGVMRIDGLDIGLEMIRRGYAWHYKAYEKDQTADDRKLYADAEATAREENLGLWPVPPWEFRKKANRR